MSGAAIGIGAAIAVAVALSIYLAWRRRRMRTKRLVGELLQGYFDGRMAADQLGRRLREIASPGFLSSSEFHALTHAAFQGAATTRLAEQGYSREDEQKLLSLSAALTREFGLPERYRIEGWRAGRE